MGSIARKQGIKIIAVDTPAHLSRMPALFPQIHKQESWLSFDKNVNAGIFLEHKWLFDDAIQGFKDTIKGHVIWDYLGTRKPRVRWRR